MAETLSHLEGTSRLFLRQLVKTNNTTYLTMSPTHLSNDVANTTTATITTTGVESSIDHIVVRINFFTMLFGIVGNFVCICVLCNSVLLKRKFNWYLLILALADFLFCFIAFANYYVMLRDDSGRAIFDLNRVTCYLTDYVVAAVDTFCVFLTVVLSLDRLYAIVKPIKVRQFFTNLYPRQISALCLAFLLAIYTPEIFLSQRRYSWNSDDQLNFIATTTLTSTTMSTTQQTMLVAPAAKGGSNRSRTFNYSNYLTNRSNTINFIKNRLGNFSAIGTDSVPKLVIVDETPSLTIEVPRCIYLTSYDSASKMSKSEESGRTRVVYIIYCKIVLPVLLNALPGLVILMLNSALLYFIRAYYTNRPSLIFGQLLRFTAPVKQAKQRREIKLNKNQKSYFLTIIILGVWLLLTSIPYYTLCTYNWAIGLGLISDKARLKNMHIQAISSAFFNSNHCTNILIYILFHRGFRAQLFEYIAACFNLNPLVKMNPYYFAGHDDKSRLAKSSSFRRSLKRCSSEEMDSFSETVIKRNLNSHAERKMIRNYSLDSAVAAAATSSNKSKPVVAINDDIYSDANETPAAKQLLKSRLTRQCSMFEEIHAQTTPANNKLFLLNEKCSLFRYYKRVKTEMERKTEPVELGPNFANETIF